MLVFFGRLSSECRVQQEVEEGVSHSPFGRKFVLSSLEGVPRVDQAYLCNDRRSPLLHQGLEDGSLLQNKTKENDMRDSGFLVLLTERPDLIDGTSAAVSALAVNTQRERRTDRPQKK